MEWTGNGQGICFLPTKFELSFSWKWHILEHWYARSVSQQYLIPANQQICFVCLALGIHLQRLQRVRQTVVPSRRVRRTSQSRLEVDPHRCRWKQDWTRSCGRSLECFPEAGTRPTHCLCPSDDLWSSVQPAHGDGATECPITIISYTLIIRPSDVVDKCLMKCCCDFLFYRSSVLPGRGATLTQSISELDNTSITKTPLKYSIRPCYSLAFYAHTHINIYNIATGEKYVPLFSPKFGRKF